MNVLTDEQVQEIAAQVSEKEYLIYKEDFDKGGSDFADSQRAYRREKAMTKMTRIRDSLRKPQNTCEGMTASAVAASTERLKEGGVAENLQRVLRETTCTTVKIEREILRDLRDTAKGLVDSFDLLLRDD